MRFSLKLVLILITTTTVFCQWHPNITHRPRLVYLSSEINSIRNRLGSGIYNQLWNNNFRDRKNNEINGIYWKARELESPTPNTENQPRTFADRRAWIAKSAAFVYAMNKRADGITDLNNFTGPDAPHPRDWYKDHALNYLQTLDPSVLSPGAPIFWPDKAQFIDNWQWRAKEMIYYCQAYDILLGAGISRDSNIESRLAQMANDMINAYSIQFVLAFLVPKNNHILMMASAIGNIAVTLNDHTDAKMWIDEAMTLIDYTLYWTGTAGGPQVDSEGGYAEGPFYLKYSLKHLLPLFIAMRNFNGDWTETYYSNDYRSPWYDPGYQKIYDWITKIRMPEGRLPILEDTYQDSYLPELAILGGYYSWPYESFDPALSNEALLNWQLSSLFDLRIEYIVAGNATPQNVPANWNRIQIMPEAGSVIFRSDWGTEAVYLHLSGQNSSALYSARTHDHADVTSFTLGYKGQILALDAGYIKWEEHYSVNKPESHNLILVSGFGPLPPSGPYVEFTSTFPYIDFYNFSSITEGFIQNSYVKEDFAYSEVTASYGRKYEMIAQQNGQEVYDYIDGDNTEVNFIRSILFVDNKYFIMVDDIDNQNSETLQYQWLCHGNAGGTSGGSIQSVSGGLIWINNGLRLQCNTTAPGGVSNVTNALFDHGDGYDVTKQHRTVLVDKDAVDTQFLSVLYPYDDGIGDPSISEFSSSNYAGIFIDRTNSVFGNRYEIVLSQKAGSQVSIPQQTFGSVTVGSIETDADILTMSFDHNDPNNPEAMKIFAKGITYLRYDDGNVIFYPKSNTTSEFEIKYHFQSFTSTAIEYNNQRKMVWDDTFQKYHMVYEDDGDIYYTTTAGPDNAWTAEEPVAFDPDPTYQYAFPAVTAENGVVVIVWQERNVGFSNIYLRVKDAAGWHDEKLVANFVFGSTGDPVAAPVVAKATEPGVFLVVWHDYIFNNLRIRAYDYSKDTFGEITDIPSTNGNSMYPSLAEDRFHDEHLVWEESGDIYYTKFDHYFDIQGEEHYVWHISKEKVSSGTGYSEHVYPSVTTDYDTRPNVVWQAYSGPALESQIILHRRRESSGGAESTWGSVTSFIGNDSYYKPSITGFPGVSSNQELRAVWRRDDNSIWIGKYNGNTWSTIYTWLYGFDPNVSANMSADMAAKMVFRNSGFSPYTLTTTSNNLSNTPPPTERFGETTTGEDVRHHRGVLTLGNGEIAFELGAFEIDGDPVNLLAYSDTLIVNRHKQWAELFRTEVFPVSDRAELRYFRGFEILNRDTLRNVIPPGTKLEFRLEAIDAQSQRVLATLDRQMITRNIPPDLREYKTISFRLSDPGEVYLRVGLGLPEGLDIRQSMVEAHYESDEDSLAKQFAGDKLSAELTPARFELEQNYPNPFNPQTTIRFALPEPALVKLEIYDITGRKIRELINNALKAGFYDVKWDGKDQTGMQVTSGMYIYRIKAGDFVKSRKLMLIR